MGKTLFQKEFIEPFQKLRHSETAAFCIAGKFYSYKQVWDIVDSLTPCLIKIEDGAVGLYATDSVYTYASILALWMVGKAYVPLNPNQPAERHREVLLSVGCGFVLTSDKFYKADIEGIKYLVTTEVESKCNGESLSKKISALG